VASEVKNFEINFMLLQELDSRLDFYTPVIISSEETVKKNPELVKKFLRSVQKGYIYAVDNPDSAAEILIYAVPEIDGSIVKASQKYLAGQYIAESEKWGEMQLSIWRTFSDWMYENNLIENRLQAEKAFTNEFLP
jgi:ABC-type nitrate/sulfonate/bicarbonate transport system substrate-binding protein